MKDCHHHPQNRSFFQLLNHPLCKPMIRVYLGKDAVCTSTSAYVCTEVALRFCMLNYWQKQVHATQTFHKSIKYIFKVPNQLPFILFCLRMLLKVIFSLQHSSLCLLVLSMGKIEDNVAVLHALDAVLELLPAISFAKSSNFFT